MLSIVFYKSLIYIIFGLSGWLNYLLFTVLSARMSNGIFLFIVLIVNK